MKRIIKNLSAIEAELAKHDRSKVDYVKQCREAIIDEINKLPYSGDTDTDTPARRTLSAIKRDYLIGAVEDDMMTEEEFEDIFDLLDLAVLEYSHRYA